MQIHPGISVIDTALWLENEEILIINDLHIGYEQALHFKGILVPRFQLEEICDKLNLIFEKVKPKKVVINGDLKHVFGKVLQREWKEVLQFLDFLLVHVSEVVIIQGNHDPMVKFIAEKRDVSVVKEIKFGEIHIVHGDELVETDAEVIIIGHEHPAVKIHEGAKWEKYKCFLKGKWQRKVLIAVPSFNPLLEGTNILEGKMLSPFLKKIDDFEVFVVGKGEVFSFGMVKSLR
tara:strand:+ start:69660 stop:70358 length:699 start_codon:yes stop_codon:yes gene_type:complete